MFSEVKSILIYKPYDYDRSEEERLKLMNAINLINFFHDKSNIYQEVFLRECQKYLKLEQFTLGECIFKQNDAGDKLYIVLEGAVDIFCFFETSSSKRISERKSNFNYQISTQRESQKSISHHSPVRIKTRNQPDYMESQVEKLKTYHAGECFGEAALTLTKPRYGTAKVATERVYLASINKHSYDLVFLNSTNEIESKLVALQNIFSSIPNNILIRLSYNFQKKEYDYQQFIYRQGQDADSFYLIIDGEVSIEAKTSKIMSSPQELLRSKSLIQKTHQLTRVIGGEMFGLEEVIEQIPRLTSARCISHKLSVYSLPKSNYFQYIKTVVGASKDIELAAINKRNFYMNQLADLQYHSTGYKKKDKVAPQKGVRTQIEEEVEMDHLLRKLSPVEFNKIMKKVDVESPGRDKREKFEYKLEDLEKKKQLLGYFMNTTRVSKDKDDNQTSLYFDRREQRNQGVVRQNTDKFLSFKNPFFSTNHTFFRHASPDVQQSNGFTHRSAIDKLKELVTSNRDVDKNIISIQKIYTEERNNIGLPDVNNIQELSYYPDTRPQLSQYLQLQQSPNNAKSSRSMISSKHNMFRVRPNKFHLKSYLYTKTTRQSSQSNSNS